MLYSHLEDRPRGGRLFIVVATVTLMLVGLAPSAVAVIDTDNACPDPRSAGFADITDYPRHVREAIDCLADYDITEGTTNTRFSPEDEVTRWQMALFLIRQAEIHDIDLPSGSTRGFTDIGALPLATQRAINQLVQLDITEGTTATTFSPFEVVPRWQMALFITRLLDAAGKSLPSGSSQGFNDIGVFPAATEEAINQLAQLDITEGIAAGRFGPNGNVTRWQMALFLTRTLEADGVTPRTITTSRTRVTAKVGAPDLERVTFVDEDEGRDETRLAFEFDETVAKSVDTDKFLLVGWDGTLTEANIASNSNDDDFDEVQADFDTVAYENAVAATVLPDAVEDIDDLGNTMGSYGLRRITVETVDWPDDYPELLSVGRYDDDNETVEFEFDLEEQLKDDNEDLSVVGSASDFVLVSEDGTLYEGDAIDDIDHNIVTVDFSTGGLDQGEWNDIVRGFVARGTVEEPGGLDNLPVAVDVSDSGRTDTPYIDDIDLSDIDDGIVVFEFNEGLNDFEDESGNFALVLHDGTVLTSEDEDRNDDTNERNEVIVTFNGGNRLPSDLIIYATAYDEAVDGFGSDLSAPDTYSMKYTFDRSDTAGPDLLSSEGSTIGLSTKVFRIVLTFDEDIDESNTTFSESSDLLGWDEDGELVDISGGEMDIDDDVITIEFEDGDTGYDELEDDEVVKFGIYADEIADEFGFTSYPDGVGCDCDK